MSAHVRRRTKGVSFIELVKFLKVHRRTNPMPELSRDAEALLTSVHVLPTVWYPFAPVAELTQFTYRRLLRSREEAALQMGIAGSTLALGTYHKTFVKPGDPRASVLAMRHTWPLFFDFGVLSAKEDGPHAAVFTLEGYPDVNPGHGWMIVGWHRAAALVAGAELVRGELLECPWRDDSPRLVHRVEFR